MALQIKASQELNEKIEKEKRLFTIIPWCNRSIIDYSECELIANQFN